MSIRSDYFSVSGRIGPSTYLRRKLLILILAIWANHVLIGVGVLGILALLVSIGAGAFKIAEPGNFAGAALVVVPTVWSSVALSTQRLRDIGLSFQSLIVAAIFIAVLELAVLSHLPALVVHAANTAQKSQQVISSIPKIQLAFWLGIFIILSILRSDLVTHKTNTLRDEVSAGNDSSTSEEIDKHLGVNDKSRSVLKKPPKSFGSRHPNKQRPHQR